MNDDEIIAYNHDLFHNNYGQYLGQYAEDSSFYGNVFTDWLHPASKEERQMYQQLQMEKLSPQARMEGLKAAGINPLTAASAVAGANSSSPQPASSVNPIGDVAGAASSFAGGLESLANRKIGLSKLNPEIRNINADSEKKLAEIGLTDAQIKGVLTDNSYKDADWQSRINIQRQQFDNLKADYQNILANHSLIMKTIDEKVSSIELNGSLQEYYDAMKLKIDEETRWQKELNDFRINHKLFINESGIDGYIWNLAVTGADSSQFDSFVALYSDYRGNVQSAISDAQFQKESQYAYSIANAQETAKSLNSIITDWNTPSSGLWSLIEKSFNISGNRKGKNNIGSALDAKDNPSMYAGYTQLVVGLQLSLDSLDGEIEAANSRNDLKSIRDLTRQKEGLKAFIESLTFDEYKKHMSTKQ